MKISLNFFLKQKGTNDMEKKRYMTPTMEEVRIKQQYHLLAGSVDAEIEGESGGSEGLTGGGTTDDPWNDGL